MRLHDALSSFSPGRGNRSGAYLDAVRMRVCVLSSRETVLLSEVCIGQNFSMLPGTAREAFGSIPKVTFTCVARIRPKCNFIVV